MSSRILSVVVTVLGITVLAGDAFSEHQSLKEQLIGAWDLSPSIPCARTAAD